MRKKYKMLNLTVHGKDYVMLEPDGWHSVGYSERIREVLTEQSEQYYVLDSKKIFVTKTGMFHLEMELSTEIEFY